MNLRGRMVFRFDDIQSHENHRPDTFTIRTPTTPTKCIRDNVLPISHTESCPRLKQFDAYAYSDTDYHSKPGSLSKPSEPKPEQVTHWYEQHSVEGHCLYYPIACKGTVGLRTENSGHCFYQSLRKRRSVADMVVIVLSATTTGTDLNNSKRQSKVYHKRAKV